jgi:2,4-dienoyl-CoA reductase-like NADH-dependent reductase (Old Yellow Enzyme family)
MVGLLDPLKVKGFTLRNRIVLPPMHTGLATGDGAVTERLVDHYVRRSRALGLVIVEHSYVRLDGRLSERQLGIHVDQLVPGLEKLSNSIHAAGATVVIQINHAGREAMKADGLEPVAPSATEDARELTVEEIGSLAESFATAAERAVKSGFDGVEIHGAHGFLLDQFYSPLSNRRRDGYGGSLENRMRFPLEVVEKVKNRVCGRLLLYRLGSVDLDPAGVHIEDSVSFAKRLEEAGVDIIDVSGGLCGDRPIGVQRRSGRDRQGYFIPQAQRIRRAVKVPVIGVGGVREPRYADRVVREGRVDLVAVGRELLRDPDWAARAVELLSRG